VYTLKSNGSAKNGASINRTFACGRPSKDDKLVKT
jgi:hypothetical protein